MKKQVKLVTITRKDLSAGYQLAQSIHAATAFAHEFPIHFQEWWNNSNYVIALSVDDENHLKTIFNELKCNGANVVAFTEPDIDNQLTSICYYGTPEMRKITQNLDLALKN